MKALALDFDTPLKPSKPSLTEAVAQHFRAHPGEWLDGIEFQHIGGIYAWRSRISGCRTELGMVIENRQRRIKRPDGSMFVVSEYRYVPAAMEATA